MVSGRWRPFRRRWTWLVVVAAIYCLCSVFGLTQHLYSIPFEEFKWPPYVDVARQVAAAMPSLDSLGAVGVRPAKDFIPPHCENLNASLDVGALNILVKSSVGNFKARNAIRSTWGGRARSVGACVVFVVGTTDDDKVMSQLLAEHSEYKDILVGGFRDAYRNNTRKFVLSLAASSGLIPGVPSSAFALFVDDDYLVNTGLLLAETRLRDPAADLYAGFRFDSSPFRFVLHKHAVPLSVYPFSRYPPYISAGCVLLSRSTAKKMVAAVPFVNLYAMDDVYAGIVAHRLGISVSHDKRFEFWSRAIPSDEWRRVVAAHGYSPERLIDVYDRHLRAR